jgi:RHS repeat-associated protein
VFRDGTLELEFSEEIEEFRIQDGATQLTIRLEKLDTQNLTQGTSTKGTLANTASALIVTEVIPLTATFPVEEGLQARQRVRLTPETAPVAGDQVRLVVEGSAVADLFKNSMATNYELLFTWPTPPAQILGGSPDSALEQQTGFNTVGLEVLDDTAAPYVEQAYVETGFLVLELSEPASLTNATAAITLDGATTTWTQDTTGYTLTTTTALTTGSHTLTIGTGPLDLSDQGLAEAFTLDFALTASAATTAPNEATSDLTAAAATATATQGLFLYERPRPTEVDFPALANPFGYHGRQHDFETGLIYFRNRYYDPEIGRFISADPLGYVDGPSQYAFAMNDPVNYGDPLGLEVKVNFFGLKITVLAAPGGAHGGVNQR